MFTPVLIFEQWVPNFHFSQGTTNFVASPDHFNQKGKKKKKKWYYFSDDKTDSQILSNLCEFPFFASGRVGFLIPDLLNFLLQESMFFSKYIISKFIMCLSFAKLEALKSLMYN